MRHTILGVCAATLLAASTAAAQAIPQKSPEQIKASLDAHKGEFDYLLGDWEFTSVSKEYGKDRGFWSAVRLAEGAEILDEYRVVGDEGETYYASSTIRGYNAVLDRWELVSAEPGAGLQNFGTARRVGAEMHIEQKFGVMSVEAVHLADPLLRHPAGPVLLGRRALQRRREDVGKGSSDDRSAPHRPRAFAGAAGAGEEIEVTARERCRSRMEVGPTVNKEMRR